MKHRTNISASRLLLRTLLTVLLFIVIRGISARYLLEYLDSRSPAVIIAADLLFLSILGLLFLYRDAKAYLASAASLREDEELFTAFIRHSPIFTYIKEVTPDHSIVLRCSDNFEVMTCVKAEEMIGKTMEEIFPPEFAAKFTADDQNVVARGSILRLQEELNGRTYLTMKYPITIGERSLLAGYTIDITDYKLAEEKLKESEEKYRALVEWSPDAIAIHVNGRIVFVNNAVLTLMRSDDKETFLGRSVIEFVHDDDRTMVIDRMKQSAQERRELPIAQERFVRSDGTTVDVEVKSIPINFENQPAVQLIVRDISERKSVEAALKESEQKYRSLVENVDTGIVAHAPDTHIIFCNDTASEILGLTRDQMLGKTAVDPAWHFIRENGEHLPIAEYPVNRAMSQEGFDGSHILGVIVPGREGPTWVQCSAHRTVDHTGTISQVVVTFFDITFRKNAEASLQASELRFKKLLQDVQSVAVQGYAPDGTIQYWNKASERLYGYTEEEAIGKNLLNLLIPEESKEIVRQNMAAMAETGEPIRSSELSLLRKDGTRVSVFSSHTIVRIPGRTQELFCIDIDLTERKIAEESLRHSQKLESIGTLAGGIAHDFNNLLVAILGQSSLGLSKLPKESPAAENIAKAIKASERAATLTRQLLAYSGRGKFFPSVIDLNALVNENAQMLELSIPKNAQVRYELGTPDIMIKADAGQVQQLIMNLMINAGEAIGQQHGSITLRTDRLMLAPHDIHRWMIGSSPLNEGKYALLQVTDTGCGIKEDSLPKIFDPFFSTKFTGRGLGLAAVLGIIRGHGGGIHIESEEGKGTVFEVILPLVEERKNVPMHTPPEKKTFDGTGRTILVIDDELAVLELLNDILTDIHCTVIGMNDPLEAIEYFRAHGTEIAMVILDYSMPKMNGKEVFEQLVTINRDVKVLLCSGYSEDETFSLFTQHRPEGFFQKPYSRDALLQRMTEMLSIPSGRTSP